MATSSELQHCVSSAIQVVRRRVHDKRLAHPEKKHKLTDYPAMVIACGYSRSCDVFWSQSATPINYNYCTKIKDRLENALGAIGTKRNGCKNTIGACAEPHAADLVVKKFPGCNMNELQFSDAYRPRTAQRRGPCKNCKDAFFEVL